MASIVFLSGPLDRLARQAYCLDMPAATNSPGTFAYANNTDIVIGEMYHRAILSGIANGGQMPEELADLIALRLAPVKNADGSDRWLVEWA